MSFKYNLSLKMLKLMGKWGTIDNDIYIKFARNIVLKKYGLDESSIKNNKVNKNEPPFSFWFRSCVGFNAFNTFLDDGCPMGKDRVHEDT